jgi:hypothetical protein
MSFPENKILFAIFAELENEQNLKEKLQSTSSVEEVI